MMNLKRFVLGIDGGGTYTRAVVADDRGNLLSHVKGRGANPDKNKNASENILDTIGYALKGAGLEIRNIDIIAAGIAGLNAREDFLWAEKLFDIPEFTGKKLLENDGKIAQIGAFGGGAGIALICGTGSIVYGINEEGHDICNYQFGHRTEAGARYLSYSAVYKIIGGVSDKSDKSLEGSVFEYWKVRNVEELTKLALRGFELSPLERDRLFSEMACIVTREAERGSKTAQFSCMEAVESLAEGARLVGSSFKSETVLAAPCGGVFENTYMKKILKEILGRKANKKYTIIEPRFEAIIGSVLMAYMSLGIQISEEIIERLNSVKSDKI